MCGYITVMMQIIVLSESFKYNINITRKNPANGNTKEFKIAVSLEYISNFWRNVSIN